MAITLTIALWAVVLICLATLVLPVRFDLHVRTEPKLHYSIVVRLVFGHVPGFSLKRDMRHRSEPSRTHKKDMKRRSTKRGRAMITAAPDLFRGLLSAVQLEALRLDATFGADDPADTGHLYGLMSPILYGLPPSDRYRVHLRPDFNGSVIEGNLEARVRVIPLRIAGTLLRFGWRVFGPSR